MSDFETQRDDVYRALGRYFVEFSRLFFWMRMILSRYLSQGGPDLTAPTLALGELPAYNLTGAFFAICRHANDLDADEQAIATLLEKAVLDELGRRNDFAHGDWNIGGNEEGLSTPMILRIKPAKKAGAIGMHEYSAEHLDTLSDELASLRQLVTEYGEICLRQGFYDPRIGSRVGIHPEIPVRDVLTLEGSRRSGRVVRRAGLHWGPTSYH